jgi:hypothetical protein
MSASIWAKALQSALLGALLLASTPVAAVASPNASAPGPQPSLTAGDDEGSDVGTCTGCEATYLLNPASGSTGWVVNCSGQIGLMVTIVAAVDGTCPVKPPCSAGENCHFRVQIDYQSTCPVRISPYKCGFSTLPILYPAAPTWTYYEFFLWNPACGTTCRYVYDAWCDGCTSGTVKLSFQLKCSACTQT